MKTTDIPINLTYPMNQYFEYITKLWRLNLDKEREIDIKNNNGFIIDSPQSIKKELKNPNGIYSSRFGASMDDINPYQDRYKCQCGATYSRLENKTICPKCGTMVKYVDDNFGYFGYIVLNDYYAIHPGLYKSLSFFIGEKALKNILTPKDTVDENGNPIEKDPPKDEPFYGIGMIGFAEKIDEIIEYYRQKNNKFEYYKDIRDNRDLILTHSIPVFTTYLRPFNVDGRNFTFEGTNKTYNIMARLAHSINKKSTGLYRLKKSKNELLFDLQTKWNSLYEELEKILSGKKGTVRSLVGGRVNFISRDVIIGNNDLRIDQVTLPYKCMLEWYWMQIINILQSTYNKGYNYAYNIWYEASINPDIDPLIYKIIKDLINDPKINHGHGPSVIINRNPTISFGSILEMEVVDITDNYTMAIPLQILAPLAADFDGDVLNVLYIINDDFRRLAHRMFNPRNALYISHNDGQFDNDLNHSKDTIINFNTLMRYGRSAYSQEDLNAISKIIH